MDFKGKKSVDFCFRTKGAISVRGNFQKSSHIKTVNKRFRGAIRMRKAGPNNLLCGSMKSFN